jgi:hypothetical protein
MSYLKFIIVIIVTLISCNIDIKNNRNSIKSVNTKISESKIYNDILNELIEDHFYYRFLGEERNSLLVKFYHKKIDSITFNNEILKEKEEILKAPVKKSIIFLDKRKKKNNNFTKYLQNIKSEDINKFLVKKDLSIVKDSLGFKNLRLDKSSFDLKLANIKNLNYRLPNDYNIGYFGFSNLFLNNSRDQGLVFYYINCGAKCGELGLLLIHNVNNKWTIVEKEIFIKS